ncbi:hypothetical protein [Chitinophaga sp.]|uniref:hypothetical protein n=1 Tax=Chitinophaga sp. TaxID=1869181 RepID=UPI00263842F3|nr:hypothetical protein [uncultured Chitinophaga sp.]
MSTLRFFTRPHVQLLLLSLACIIWGENFASREALITDAHTHWYWPHVYGYMSAVLLAEAVIYWLAARFLQWPWMQHFHIATMSFFAVTMWLFEITAQHPGSVMQPLSFVVSCIAQYLLLAGHLAFFTHITAGIIIGRSAPARS